MCKTAAGLLFPFKAWAKARGKVPIPGAHSLIPTKKKKDQPTEARGGDTTARASSRSLLGDDVNVRR